MKRWMRFSTATVLGLAITGIPDTLQLKGGRVPRGCLLRGTQAVLRFETRGNVETYSRTRLWP
jgi:hypothetical protein